MSSLKVYICPFDLSGSYTSYEDVTEYVVKSSISDIKKEIDGTDYDIGVVKIGTLSISMSNTTGKFSDVSEFGSMFNYKRSDSLIKIIYDPNDYQNQCGDVICGTTVLTDTTTIFEGMINDSATTQNIGNSTISFRCFSYDYLFKRIEVPFSSISVGNYLSDIFLLILDQAPFNTLVTVSASNINPTLDLQIDNKDDLENKVVFDVLDELLMISNSVMFIEDNIVYISGRNESVTLKYEFYGQASNNGIENLEEISEYRNGMNRVFNYCTFKDRANLKINSTSVQVYGILKNEIDSTYITNSTSIDSILQSMINEFSEKKIEMYITAKFNEDLLNLNILDKISIDYPSIPYTSEGTDLPVFGSAIFGNSIFPYQESSIVISNLTYFKITSFSYNLKTERIKIGIREV